MHSYYDLVVVGAGISGLVCAHSYLRLSPKSLVVVLEARERVGGKTLTAEFKGACFDLGGQWISPQQHLVIDLVSDLGLHLELQPWFDEKQEIQLTSGTSDAFPHSEVLQLKALVLKIDNMAKGVQGLPWGDNPNALLWDKMSVANFLESENLSPNIKKEMQNFVVATLAVNVEELSLLHFLLYINSAGNMALLGDGPLGAQHWKIKEGAQSMSERLSRKIAGAGGRIITNSCVHKVTQTTSCTTCTKNEISVCYKNTSSHGNQEEVIHCRHVVMAMSPLLCNSITFVPALPLARQHLHQNMISGRAVKVVVLYENAFWKQSNIKKSTSPIEDLGPITNIFPATVGTYHGLVGLITASSATEFIKQSDVEKQRQVFHQIASFFGVPVKTVKECVHFVFQDWLSDPHSKGCYAALMPPGLISSTLMSSSWCGDVLGRQWGCISFGGTETARKWSGYFEGAVESGIRTAVESLLDIKGVNYLVTSEHSKQPAKL